MTFTEDDWTMPPMEQTGEVLPDVAYQAVDFYTQPAGNVIASQPAVTTDSGGNFFTSLSRGAENLLNFYGQVTSVQAQADAARFNREIQRANVDLNQTRALGAVEIGKAQTAAQIEIAKSQAQAAAEEQRRRASSIGTSAAQAVRVVQDNKLTVLLGVAALVLAYLQYRKK